MTLLGDPLPFGTFDHYPDPADAVNSCPVCREDWTVAVPCPCSLLLCDYGCGYSHIAVGCPEHDAPVPYWPVDEPSDWDRP